jgi:hypothetical protein
MNRGEDAVMSLDGASKPAWSYWQLNPRFYRRPRRPPNYQELYWIVGFEVLATRALGIGVYLFSIAPGMEQHRRRMEIYLKLRDIQGPAPSTEDRAR